MKKSILLVVAMMTSLSAFAMPAEVWTLQFTDLLKCENFTETSSTSDEIQFASWCSPDDYHQYYTEMDLTIKQNEESFDYSGTLNISDDNLIFAVEAHKLLSSPDEISGHISNETWDEIEFFGEITEN